MIVSSNSDYYQNQELCLGGKCDSFDQNQEYDESLRKSGCVENECIYFDQTIIPRVKYYYKITALSQSGEAESDFSSPNTIGVESFCFKGPRWGER